MMTYINFPRRIAAFQEELEKAGVGEHVSVGNNEPDYVLEPGYMQMAAVICNRPGVAGFHLERPLLITEGGNEVLSRLPIEPWIIDCGRTCAQAP